jgi:MFS family permease
MRGSLRVPQWAGRNFRLLAISAVVTTFGSSGSVVAAAFAVLRVGGGATDVGVVAAGRTAALVGFLLVGGAVADRFPRPRVMVAANVLNCLSQGAFALVVLTGRPAVWGMVGLSAAGGAGQAFFAPAAEGMVLSSVSGARAGQAFAAFRMGVNAATVLGAAAAGALIASIGPGWVLALDAFGFAVAAVLRSFLRAETVVPGPGPQSGPEPRSNGMLQQLREGWREFASRRWLWGIVVQFSVVNAVVAAGESVYGPLVAQSRLGGAGPWGLALSAFGAGTLCGGVLMTRWRPRRILLAGTVSVFPLALPLVALAVVAPLPLLVAAMAVSGLSIEVFGVMWMVALRQEIPQEKLSRVAAYDWLGSVAMVPLATAAAGPTAAAFGMPAALWSAAALVVLLTSAALAAPEIRRLTLRSG